MSNGARCASADSSCSADVGPVTANGSGLRGDGSPHGQIPGSVPIPPSHHGHRLTGWPLRNAIELGALEGAVPSARIHTRQLLWEWGRAELHNDAGAVVSELVTNAVMATTGLGPAVPPVRLWLGSDAERVLVAVADVSPRPPVRLTPGPDDVGGRGLGLVEAFSSRWGWHPVTAGRLTKVVWAEFST
jgi:anti-sigma regulatory factor (Ser/Thr protein kinase)